MACGDDDKLSLDSIRESLIRQEDTIIFNLIERIKFPINPTLYKQQLPPSSNFSGSLFQYLFQETESLQSKVGRYLAPEENPFFPDNLSDSIVPLTKCTPVLHPAAESVNVNEKILDTYINQMLPLFCTEVNDDANFATTAACDIQLLQALSRRIHYGKFVAEVKFRDSTDEYKSFILDQDRDALMKLLTFEAVEEMVKKRVAKKAKVFGQEVILNDNVEEVKGKIDPLLVSRLYDEWVIDGERGNEYRRQLLPSYKASRRKYWHQLQGEVKSPRSTIERSHRLILDVLQSCNVPVVKIESHEADDVIATLVEQVLQRGHRVVVASPDKDFKQLISDDVQIVMPVPEFNRWSFYTLKHYVAQYNCDPRSDLSLRCILGDEVDGVPGIQHVVPGFGRKTALKLLKKHGTLENLLNAASVRSVGRQYAQDALIKYADYLRRNYEVLSLKRDVSIHIEEQWLTERDARNDSLVLSNFVTSLEDSRNLNLEKRSHSIG